MPLFGSSKQINETTLNQDERVYDFPIGIDGYDNYTLGPYAQDQSLSVGAPISGDFGDDAFAPSFRFYNPISYASPTAPSQPNFNDYAQTPEVAAHIQTGRDSGYYDDTWSDAQIAENYWNNIGKSAPPSLPSASTLGNFGGAVQGSGFNLAGTLSAPVASGENSFAAQLGSGLVNQSGDFVSSPVISAPVSGPAFLAGGDQRIAGNLVAGNSGPVSISTADPSVARAAIHGVADANQRALSFAGDALRTVADSKRDPAEKTTGAALFAMLALGALAVLN